MSGIEILAIYLFFDLAFVVVSVLVQTVVEVDNDQHDSPCLYIRKINTELFSCEFNGAYQFLEKAFL